MLKRLVIALCAALLLVLVQPIAATAVNNDTISVYYDAPFVQGSYTTGSGGVQETFDSASSGATCPNTLSVGTMTGACRVDPVGQYGGAATPAGSTAAVGGSGSNYATTVSGNAMTLTLASASKYFGLWWSAGSNGNTVQFYSGNELLITLTTQTIINQFGTVPNPWPGSNTFTAINGQTYSKGWYFGNPRGYSSTTPNSASSITPNEPFVYLHLFAGGNLSFDKVVLSGGGFEFDNLAVSTQPQNVDQRLVLSQTLYSNHSVTFDNNTGSGSMSDQVANSSTALAANSFTKNGFDFVGWNTQPNGQGTAYQNRELYSFDEDLNLYAQWSPSSYTVIYDTQGGSAVSNGSYTFGSTVSLPGPPTRPGFTFSGWFTGASGGNPLGSSYSPSGTGNITLYAQWTEVPNVLPATGASTTLAWGAGLLLLTGMTFLLSGLAIRRR